MSCLLDGPIALEGWKVEGIIFNVSRKQTSTIERLVMFLYIFDGPIAFDGWKGEGITFKLSGK